MSYFEKKNTHPELIQIFKDVLERLFQVGELAVYHVFDLKDQFHQMFPFTSNAVDCCCIRRVNCFRIL